MVAVALHMLGPTPPPFAFPQVCVHLTASRAFKRSFGVSSGRYQAAAHERVVKPLRPMLMSTGGSSFAVTVAVAERALPPVCATANTL